MWFSGPTVKSLLNFYIELEQCNLRADNKPPGFNFFSKLQSWPTEPKCSWAYIFNPHEFSTRNNSFMHVHSALHMLEQVEVGQKQAFFRNISFWTVDQISHDVSRRWEHVSSSLKNNIHWIAQGNHKLAGEDRAYHLAFSCYDIKISGNTTNSRSNIF